MRGVIFADQFARHAKHRSLQTKKVGVACLDPIHIPELLPVPRERRTIDGSGLAPEVARLVPPVDKWHESLCTCVYPRCRARRFCRRWALCEVLSGKKLAS